MDLFMEKHVCVYHMRDSDSEDEDKFFCEIFQNIKKNNNKIQRAHTKNSGNTWWNNQPKK